jgi:hypothetical protein
VIVPPSLREAHRAGFSRYMTTGESRILDRRIEITALRADGSAAVLTGPSTVVNDPAQLVRSRPPDACGMAQVDLQCHPLTASAALVWSGDLPRPLQQILFDSAESLSATPSLAVPAPR